MSVRRLLSRGRLATARLINTVHTVAAPAAGFVEAMTPLVTEHPAARAAASAIGVVRESGPWATAVLWNEYSANVGVRGWVAAIEPTLDGRTRVTRMMDMSVHQGRFDNRSFGFRHTRGEREFKTQPGEEPTVWRFLQDRVSAFYGPVVRVSIDGGGSIGGLVGPIEIILRNASLDELPSPTGDDLVAYLESLLEVAERRTVLLHGRPGVGKSVMARYIASRIARGRVLVVDNTVLSDGDLVSGLALLSPDVIIIDELDKVQVRPETMDRIKTVARLVIYTANNGTDDTAIDGSLTRCGRIDVSREIGEIGVSPNGSWLPECLRSEVLSWPRAAQEEVRIRLDAFGSEADLSDIRERLEMKCRSVKS